MKRDQLLVLVVALGAIALWLLSRRPSSPMFRFVSPFRPMPPTVGPISGQIGQVIQTIPPLPLGAGGAPPVSTDISGDLGLVLNTVPPLDQSVDLGLELPWDEMPGSWQTVGVG